MHAGGQAGGRAGRWVQTNTRRLAGAYPHPLTASSPAVVQFTVGAKGGVFIQAEDNRRGPARVVKADIVAAKSIVHVIDKVRG